MFVFFQGWAATILLDVSQHRATIIYCSIVIVKKQLRIGSFPRDSCYLVLTDRNNSKRSWLYRKIGKRRGVGVFLQTKFHFLPISLFSGAKQEGIRIIQSKGREGSRKIWRIRTIVVETWTESFPRFRLNRFILFLETKVCAHMYFRNLRWKLGKQENRANLTRKLQRKKKNFQNKNPLFHSRVYNKRESLAFVSKFFSISERAFWNSV